MCAHTWIFRIFQKNSKNSLVSKVLAFRKNIPTCADTKLFLKIYIAIVLKVNAF
jgi:hypothetical protein